MFKIRIKDEYSTAKTTEYAKWDIINLKGLFKKDRFIRID